MLGFILPIALSEFLQISLPWQLGYPLLILMIFFLQQTIILILSWCGFIALICNASLKQTFQSVSANFFRSLWLDKQDQLIGRLFDPSVHVPIDANKCCQSSCRWLINTHRILVIGPSPVPTQALPGPVNFFRAQAGVKSWGPSRLGHRMSYLDFQDSRSAQAQFSRTRLITTEYILAVYNTHNSTICDWLNIKWNLLGTT